MKALDRIDPLCKARMSILEVAGQQEIHPENEEQEKDHVNVLIKSILFQHKLQPEKIQ